MAVSRAQVILNKQWFWIIIAAFAVVYLTSLTFGYIDGDDASSIAYHLYGRDSAIQPPYSPYHAMMDRVLGVLPANEPLLRTVAVGLTSVAAAAIVVFMLAIIFDWLKDDLRAPRWIIALAVLLASPEFFYLGLVYIPGVIAMALVLAAHLILRRGGVSGEAPDFRSRRGQVVILLSAVVFGIGAACRWDITVYGAVIAADLVFGYDRGGARLADMLRRRWVIALAWGALALAAFLAALAVSGYGPATIIAQVQKYQEFTEERTFRIIETIGSIQPLVTPAFALFVLVGLIALIRRRDPLLIVIAVGLIVILPWANRGIPKLMLPGVPGLMACSVLGFSILWAQFKPERWQTAARVLTGALLLLPWLVGVRVAVDDTAFGPGFETRPFNRPTLERPQFGLAILGPGAMFPTSEGPRSLFGHAAVLLGGAWRTAADERWGEIETDAQYALEHDAPLISTGNISNFVVALWRRGYTTTDPRDPPGHVTGDLVRRVFTNAEGDSIEVFHREIATTQLERLDALPADINEIVIYGYPRTLRAIYQSAPETLVEPLGTVSALLDLEKIRPIIEQIAQS